ncbi:MAG TPA: hypothetical protein VF594_01185, partial [Rubricoccaceae bacterium]
MDLLAPLPPDHWGREPDANAFVELHNLVAAAESVYDIGPTDTDRIARERGVDLQTAFRDERVGLYVRLFEDAEAQGDLTPDGLHRLGHLARTLALTPADVRTVHTQAFGWTVERALADDCLTVEERLHLYALQQTLGLDPMQTAGTVQTAARQRLLVAVARVLCDGKLAPDEAAEVAQAVQALGIAVPTEVAAMLNRAASAWEDARPLPRLPASVRLGEGESEHARLAARWAFKRADSLRDAFADGVSTAATALQLFPWDRFMAPLRQGDVVLTSARLVLLDAERATQYVPLKTVDEAIAFSDALVLRIANDARRIILTAGDETQALAQQVVRALDALPHRQPAHGGHPAHWRPIASTDPSVRADEGFGWEIGGTAVVTAGRLVLTNVTGAHSIARTLIVTVERYGRTLRVD